MPGSARSSRSARRTTPSKWPRVSIAGVSDVPASSRIDETTGRPLADANSSNLGEGSILLRGRLIRQPEQALGVEVADLFLVRRGNGHLLEELPAGFHTGERIVGGEHDPVDADHVDHGLIGVE